MAAMAAHPPEMAPNPDIEKWKVSVRRQIEENLLPQVQDAKESFQKKLSEAPVDEFTREKLAKEHNDTLKNLRRIADDLYRDQIQQARARWAQGGQVESIHSGDFVEQQRLIMEQFQRSKLESAGSGASNIQGNVANQRSQRTPVGSPTSDHDDEYFSHPPAPISASYVDDDRITRRPRNGSGASGYDPRSSGGGVGEYVRSAMVEEQEDMDQSDRPYYEGSGSFRRQSNTGPRPLPEFWRPTRSPDEVTGMSNTYQLARRGSGASAGSNSYRSPSTIHYPDREPGLARQASISSMGPNSYRSSSATQFPERLEHRQVTRQGSAASIGSHYYRPPSTKQIPERPEPIHDMQDIDDVSARSERERTAIRAAEEEWSEMTKARERGWKADDRYRSSNGATRTDMEEYANVSNMASIGPSSVSANPPSVPLTTSRPIEIPHRSRPPAPANRPPTNERSFSVEESGRYGQSTSPLSQGWAGPTRILTEPVTSRSPPSTIDSAQFQPPHSRHPVSIQEFQHEDRPPVARRQTFSKESQTSDTDNADWLKEEQQRQVELEANARRREEEAKRKEEDARRLEVEARRKEEEARRKEAEARRRAEEAERLEKEAKAKEEVARKKEEETRRKEAEIRKREEDVRRREQELERREAEAQRKEEEKRQRQIDESRKRDMEKRQAEAERREGDIRRREEELKRKEEAQLREEMEREEAIRLVQDLERLDAEEKEKQRLQQEEFRKREEEIRLRAYQRRSQEEYEFYAEPSRPAPAKPSTSPHSTAPRPIPNRNGSTGNVSQTDRNGTSASSYTSSSRPSFKTNTTSPSSARTSTTSANPKPTFSTPRPAAIPTRVGTSSPTPEEIAEWNRRQEEQARKQQEALLREQEQQEMKRLAEASKNINREDASKLFETHERQWADLPTAELLTWYNFPWPVLPKPKNPEELVSAGIGQYVLTQYQLANKPPKTLKDHIKEHIRRWHPDRFETRYLPKVIRGDRDKVKEGAGVVARALNELLTRSSNDAHVIL